jgi:hypothetical protein
VRYGVVYPGRMDDGDLLVVGWAEGVVDFLRSGLWEGRIRVEGKGDDGEGSWS